MGDAMRTPPSPLPAHLFSLALGWTEREREREGEIDGEGRRSK